MLINVTHAEESRVGIVDDGQLESFEIESFSREHLKGNIYKGVVQRIHPAIEAAFVDIGADRDAFLPLDEICFRNLPGGRNARAATARQGREGREGPPPHQGRPQVRGRDPGADHQGAVHQQAADALDLLLAARALPGAAARLGRRRHLAQDRGRGARPRPRDDREPPAAGGLRHHRPHRRRLRRGSRRARARPRLPAAPLGEHQAERRDQARARR